MDRSVILTAMSLRQQQVTVFCATVVVIFGILGVGIWWIAERLTTETTLQTALLMARQVEIALADSLRERSIVVQPRQGQKAQSSFWGFLGNLLPGKSTGSSSGPIRYTPSRQAEVKGLMQAFLDRSASIEAMSRKISNGVRKSSTPDRTAKGSTKRRRRREGFIARENHLQNYVNCTRRVNATDKADEHR